MELYAAAGLEAPLPETFQVGDIPAMEANCHRFLRQRCIPGGTWKSYAQLEAENAELRQRLALLEAAGKTTGNLS